MKLNLRTLKLDRRTLTRDRRTLLLVGGLALVVIVAIAGAVAFAARDDGDHLPRYPGRVAVRDGCGLHHTFFDGKDPRELCLPNVWSAVSVSWDGKRVAWDTGPGKSKGSDKSTGTGTGKGTSIPISTGIWIANSDGFNPVPVPVLPGANFDPSLSPNADRVAFLHSPRDDGHYNLWVGSTSIDNAQQLTTSSDVSSVAWSPAGDWIAYVKGWSLATLEGEIILIRPNGDDETLLTRGDSPTWAPDGSRLAYVHARNIWTIGVDGSDARMIVRNGESPAWSRDGDLIAFMREVRCGKPVCDLRVFIVGATGGEPRGIGPTYSGPRSIVFLPDPFE